MQALTRLYCRQACPSGFGDCKAWTHVLRQIMENFTTLCWPLPSSALWEPLHTLPGPLLGLLVPLLALPGPSWAYWSSLVSSDLRCCLDTSGEKAKVNIWPG